MVKRILVIDDEEPIQEVLQGCLEDLQGWEVVMALSGPEGLRLAQIEQLDGILLDVSMPGMDGFKVLQELRKNPSTASIPVIFLSALVQPEDHSKMAQLDVAGVITKPFEPVELLEKISQAFHWD